MSVVRAHRVTVALACVLVPLAIGIGSPRAGAAASGPPAGPSAPPSPGLALPREFGDPAVIATDGGYVAYSTEAGGRHIPVVTSADLRSWSPAVDALPTRPRWSTSGPVWAPAVTRRTDGAYLLAYAARHDATRHMCVSVAVSARPTGPFADRSAAPLVCDHRAGGSIDPSFFVDADGTTWLLWKSEGLTGPDRPTLHSQQIDPASLTLRGTPHRLLIPDLPWEDPLVENPSLLRVDGLYLLLYSGSRWETASYATGWALCTGPAGPCRKGIEPLMRSDVRRAGPGGASWFTVADGTPWIAYHGWRDGKAGHARGGTRALYLARPRLKDHFLLVLT